MTQILGQEDVPDPGYIPDGIEMAQNHEDVPDSGYLPDGMEMAQNQEDEFSINCFQMSRGMRGQSLSDNAREQFSYASRSVTSPSVEDRTRSYGSRGKFLKMPTLFTPNQIYA